MLGLLVGLAILATLLLAGWKINRAPPLLALTLFAMNSTLVVVGDSLRAYGLGTLFIALATIAAAWFLLKPDGKRLSLFAIAGVLAVQTLYHNAVFLGAICLGAMAVCARRKNFSDAAKIFGAGALAAVSLVPYVGGILAGREDAASLRTGLNPIRLANALPETFGYPHQEFSFVWLLLFLALLWQGVRVWRRKDSQPVAPENFRADLPLFAAVTAGVSVFGFFCFLWLAALPSQSWYFLPLMVVSALCLDLVISFWSPKIRLALAALFIISAALIVPTSWAILGVKYTNVDVWAQSLEKTVAPEDYVIVDPWHCGITFAHYFKPATPWDTLPPLADHATHRYDLVKLQLQNTNAIAPVLEKISATLRSGHRVWVVALYGWMDIPEPGTVAPPPLPPAPLGQYGWSDVPYTMSWISQVAHRLGDQSEKFERVKNPAARGIFIEEAELFVAQGWRGETNSAAGK